MRHQWKKGLQKEMISIAGSSTGSTSSFKHRIKVAMSHCSQNISSDILSVHPSFVVKQTSFKYPTIFMIYDVLVSFLKSFFAPLRFSSNEQQLTVIVSLIYSEFCWGCDSFIKSTFLSPASLIRYDCFVE